MTDLHPDWQRINVLGMILEADHVPAFLALIGVIGAAVVAAVPVILKIKADKRTSVTTELRNLYETLKKDRAEDAAAWEKKFEKQAAELVALQRDMQEFKLQKELDRRTIDRLNDRVRDLEEENDDLWGYTRAVVRWEESGGTPPLPPQPWRIRDGLTQAHEGGLL